MNIRAHQFMSLDDGEITLKATVEITPEGAPPPGKLSLTFRMQSAWEGEDFAVHSLSGVTLSKQTFDIAPQHFGTPRLAKAFDDKYSLAIDYFYNVPGYVPEDGTGAQTVTPAGLNVRCDDAPELQRRVGCVNPDFTPTVSFPASTFPTISPHIRRSQALLPLQGTKNNPLNRGRSANIDTNRNAACSTAKKRAMGPPPPSMVEPQCDEYPFASSIQGGTGSQIAWVPGAENSSQGRTISRFFRENRVVVGDKFIVEP
ncbi:NucA/NucB deoxyribonuclease domain-containing protein [Nocardia sp. NPDC058518]|uniref:NucA/NucB deoxyribonuclease domain-containing protein n=1 Tax=Nocardia sp. NPDC058518 TaxID=3346534 RepID=UPI00364CAB57